jgi:inositol transporter-like SP family MFS transporter
MASYIDSAAITGFSTSLVILQKDLSAVGSRSRCRRSDAVDRVGALIGGRLGDRRAPPRVHSVTMVLVIVAVASIAAPSFTIVTVGAVLGLGTVPTCPSPRDDRRGGD